MPDIIIVGGTCFGGDLVSAKKGYGEVVVEAGGCNEEIVECTSLDPQKLNESSFEEVHSNEIGIGLMKTEYKKVLTLEMAAIISRQIIQMN